MTHPKRQHHPMQHRIRKHVRRIMRWRQRGHGFSSKRVREVIAGTLTGMLTGGLFGYAASWQPENQSNRMLPRFGIAFPTEQLEITNIGVIAALFGVAMVVAAPMGVMLAGRLMGRRGSMGFAWAFCVIGVLAAVLIGLLLRDVFPSAMLILMLILPALFSAVGFQFDEIGDGDRE